MANILPGSQKVSENLTLNYFLNMGWGSFTMAYENIWGFLKNWGRRGINSK
jgi:hypothetical protein